MKFLVFSSLVAGFAACSEPLPIGTNPDAVEWNRYSGAVFVVRGCNDADGRLTFGAVHVDSETRATMEAVSGILDSAPLSFAIDGTLATSAHVSLGGWADTTVVISKVQPSQFLLRVVAKDESELCEALLDDARTYVAVGDGGAP